MRRAAWVVVLAGLLAVRGGIGRAMPVPEVVQPLDVRADRGNRQECSYLTGPMTPIQGFYNDDLELSFWNGPDRMAFSVAKNDVWDRRYFAAGKKIIDLEAVRRMCFGGTIPAANGPTIPDSPQALYLAYDFPCPKPVGQLIVECPDLQGPEQWTAGRTWPDAVLARAAKGTARGTLWAFLHRTRNLLVLQGDYAGLTQPLKIELWKHQDTTPQGTSIAALAHYNGNAGYDYKDPGNGPLPHPEAGSDGRFFWVRQAFPPDPTFPRGFESVMMGAVDGAACTVSAQSTVTGAGVKAVVHPLGPEPIAGYQKELRLATERFNGAESGSLAGATIPGTAATFTVMVTVVTTRDAADPLAAAKQALTQALRERPEDLATASAAASEEAIRKWRLSRVMHYNATSCTWLDSTPWHGDYHFNEGQFTPEIVNGQGDELESRLRMFEEMVPALKRNAQEVYRCRGIAFPLTHYPIKSDRVVYANFTWEWGIENTALMLQPFWQRYQYTQDLDFLKRRAYPMMVEGARFYADYVKKGEDGCYHVIPTVSQEHWGFTPEWKLNRDSVGALSFVKYHLKACLEAAKLLGIEGAEQAQWREIVAHLAPYPTLQTPAGPVYCDVRDAPELLNYNITANLVMVLWAEDISLDSPPELLELARRSYRALPDKEHSMRPGYLQQIRLYLGIPEALDLSPQGRVLSWPGRIHLYAGASAGADFRDSFSGLLAVGGFEVSARHVGQDVRSVRLTSRAGRTCRVKSPWQPVQVKVLDLAGRTVVQHRLEGDTIVFDTQAGHTYALLSGPELPLADKRYVPEEKAIARWGFEREAEGVVPDESGHGHGAKLVGGATLVAVEQGRALQLAGPQAYAEVVRTPAFDFGPDESFAIEARVRFPAGPPPAMTPIVCSMAERQYCFMLADGRAKLYLSSPRGDLFCQATGTSVLTDAKWHTLRGVRDVSDGTVRVYVDGKLEGLTPDTTEGDFTCTAPVTIGGYLWGDHSRYARGLIDDVEIKSLGKLAPKP